MSEDAAVTAGVIMLPEDSPISMAITYIKEGQAKRLYVLGPVDEGFLTACDDERKTHHEKELEERVDLLRGERRDLEAEIQRLQDILEEFGS
jgi:hypothetical protein